MLVTLQDRFRKQLDLFCYDPWDAGPWAIAVSGGGDSIALMHLAAATAGHDKLHVVTVDHGLRDVRDEIALVASQAGALGLQHHVLNWSWDRQGNLQSAARDGRWGAIADWLKEHGIEVCLTGHTSDDQAETVLMRLARGSGVAGLCGMYPTGMKGALRIVRPLLGETRETLRTYLQDSGVAWCEDPSNDDLRFDRVKARKMMTGLEQLGLTGERLVRTSDHMQAAQREMQRYAQLIAAQHVSRYAGGLALPLSLPADADVLDRLCREAIRFVGAQGYGPRAASAIAAIEQVRQGQTVTLHGCILLADRDRLLVLREPESAAAEIPFANLDKGLLWDDRWVVSAPDRTPQTSDLSVRKLGDALGKCPDWRSTGLHRIALLSTPAIWRGDTLIAAPVAGYNQGWNARIVTDFHSSLVTH